MPAYSAIKHLDEYRNAEIGRKLVEQIRRRSQKPVKLMEFCGGHTVSIFKHGIRQLLPPNIQMLSGPGCPVCVTANSDLDKAIALAEMPGVIVATFGDMVRVPASRYTLARIKAGGGDVRVVYSTQDALGIARDNPSKKVVFLGIGFETTAPTVAVSVLQAEREKLDNYHVLSMHKLCPPVMKALLDSGEVRIDGIVCPGHVSAVIGARPYEFIPRDYGVACVVSGFEPLDILMCVDLLVEQIESGQASVEVAYRRGVRAGGNGRAVDIMNEVFEPCQASWRGIGPIPGSGLRLRDKYARFDAERQFRIEAPAPIEPIGCICGDILRGTKTPADCTLFRTACSPESPVGPCMVSAEGSCSAYYLYGDSDGR